MATDPEMAQKITMHKSERPNYWPLAEIPLDLNLHIAKITCWSVTLMSLPVLKAQ
jgi:adenosyl cobinamide kinase/adenosyl cobinamide phosphate guanylyltransferase